MSTGGKAPRNSMAYRNLAANLHRRDKAKEEASTQDWRPSKARAEQKNWEDLGKSSKEFKEAYNLMMTLLRDLKEHRDPKHQEKKKKKEKK
jgi:hypothetical protein